MSKSFKPRDFYKTDCSFAFFYSNQGNSHKIIIAIRNCLIKLMQANRPVVSVQNNSQYQQAI